MRSVMQHRSSVSRFFMGLGGVAIGAVIPWAVIALMVPYQAPGILIVAFGLIVVLIGGSAAFIWLRLPRIRPLAVGLLLGAFAYIVFVTVTVMSSLNAFERMG